MPDPTTPALWDPDQYLRYHDQRTRPLTDLLAHIPEPPTPTDRPLRILDIGCGPGNSTAPLRTRWPHAHITGIDNSPQMLTTARTHHSGPNPGGTGTTDYILADARTYDPTPQHPDIIVSNAMLHWLPGHLELLPHWADTLRPGGTLAFQVPGNFTSPSHALLAELRTSPRWHHLLGEGAHRDAAVHNPGDYLQRLTDHGCTVDIWETTYHTLLPGPDPVLDWVKGSALRPVLTRLPDTADREEFLTAYRDLLRKAYPPGPHGTVFPFRRIFAIAQRPR